MGSCGGGLTWSRKRVPSLPPFPPGNAAWQNSSHRRSQAGRNPPPRPPLAPSRLSQDRGPPVSHNALARDAAHPAPHRPAPHRYLPRLPSLPPAHPPVLNTEADSPRTALTQLHVPIQRAESEQAGHSEGCHTAPRKLTVTRTSKNAFPVYAEHEKHRNANK